MKSTRIHDLPLPDCSLRLGQGLLAVGQMKYAQMQHLPYLALQTTEAGQESHDIKIKNFHCFQAGLPLQLGAEGSYSLLFLERDGLVNEVRYCGHPINVHYELDHFDVLSVYLIRGVQLHRLVIMLLNVTIMRAGPCGAAPTHDYADFGYHCSETMPKAFEIGAGTLTATVPATVLVNDCFD